MQLALVDHTILVHVHKLNRILDGEDVIVSIMAASVVDLPEPVGPVTSTNPRGLSQSLLTTAGRPSWLNDLISKGIRRKTAAVAPRWLNTLARKRASPFKPNEKSSSRLSSNRCFCESVMTL